MSTPAPLPTPPPHLDLIFSGVFGTAAAPYEIWSFGLSIDVGDPGFSDQVALTNAARAAWTANVAPQCSPQVRLTRVRAVFVTSGLYVRDSAGAYAMVDAPSDSPGTGTLSQPPPLQVALAISLQTTYDGAVGRGRFYLPGPDLGILTAGRISATRQENASSQMKAFLDAINAEVRAQFGVGVVVASAGSVKKGIPAALRPVTVVRVGSVPDTIRSRRNSLVEAYQDRPLA